MKKIIAILFLIFLVGFLPADTILVVSDVRKTTDEAMNKFKNGDYQAGVDILKKVSVLQEDKFNLIMATIKSQLPSVMDQYGKTKGIDFISQDQLGDSLIRIRQLERHEQYAMVWEFVFYNGGLGWVLISIDWNDKIKDLFPK